MRTTTVASTLALAVALALPVALDAQLTTPFRAGQWGAEFEASDDFESIGLVRFFSASTALAFNVEFSSGSQEVDDSEAENSANAIGVSLGYRMYRPLVSNVAGHLTLGGLFQRISTSNTTAGGVETENTGRGYGAFGEIGASYFITPNVSLGAAYGIQYLLTRTEVETPTATTETDGYLFTSSPVSVRISLFF